MQADAARRDLSPRSRAGNSPPQTFENLLVPPDPRDSRNIILELRAGTGGDEAALFVADCVRMYQYYAQNKGWKCEVLSTAPSELGGYKEYIMSLSGPNVFRLMQYEAGTHRVQRVPRQKRKGAFTLPPSQSPFLSSLTKMKTSRSKKKISRSIPTALRELAGSTSTRTDSAVRITHIPTGTVVAAKKSEVSIKTKKRRCGCSKRGSPKSSGEKRRLKWRRPARARWERRPSERIRTYNFPQNRVTDHRIDVTLYKLDRVMEGDLDDLTIPLVNYFYQEKLIQS